MYVSQSFRLGAQIPNNGHHSYHQRSREGYLRTLAGLGSRVAAVGTSRLLDVERPLACSRKYHWLALVLARLCVVRRNR